MKDNHLLHLILTGTVGVAHVLCLDIVLQVLVLNIVPPPHYKHNRIRERIFCPGDLSTFISSQNLWVQILVLIIELALLLLHDVVHYLGDGEVVLLDHQVLDPRHDKVAGL